MNLPIPCGVMPAFLTPFDENGRIIESPVAELVDYQLEHGLDAFYVGGSTGEGMIMSAEDRMHMAELVIKAVNGRAPVIIHVGTTDTETAVKLAQHAKKAGADGISSVPPYYYKMSKEYIKAYYTAIANASDLPFLVYNIPGLTGVSISSDFMIEMMGVKNVIGLKFTDSNLEEFRKIKAYNGGSIRAYIGFDAMLLPSLVMGGDGGIGSFYNVMPGAFSKIYDSFKAGDMQTAMETQWRLNHFIALIKSHMTVANQAPLKAILRSMGINYGTVKAPLLPIADEEGLFEHLRREGFYEFIK